MWLASRLTSLPLNSMTDSFSYQDILNNWSVPKEQQKADFMEHMYNCSGRQEKTHPMHGLYTGLWQNFCIEEAGPIMRDRYFEMMEAVRLYEEGQLQQVNPNEITITTWFFRSINYALGVSHIVACPFFYLCQLQKNHKTTSKNGRSGTVPTTWLLK